MCNNRHGRFSAFKLNGHSGELVVQLDVQTIYYSHNIHLILFSIVFNQLPKQAVSEIQDI
jgi:hypothetical protein